ncbi:MAG: tyrosine-type recombinase/integrase [Planctomycetota bacterium]
MGKTNPIQSQLNPKQTQFKPNLPAEKSLKPSHQRTEEVHRALNESVLEWDLIITLALTTGMRRSELLNFVWSNIDFGEMTIEVSPKRNTAETWEWRIKDSDRRFPLLKEDVSRLLVDLQNRRPERYPYVFVPPGLYDYIQHELSPKGKWTLLTAKDNVINNFSRQFKKILSKAHVDKGYIPRYSQDSGHKLVPPRAERV